MDRNLQFFRNNEKDIYSKYPERFVIIKEESVVGDYATFDDAINAAIAAGYDSGTYIIQQCVSDESIITQRFHSRVVFA